MTSTPPASTPPSPSPTPRGKWSARMGGALRRTSTLLSINRPSTPSEDGEGGSLRKSTSKGSLRRSTSKGSISGTPGLSPAPAVVSSPSPIAESPVREAAALQQDPVGPSPLARQETSSNADAAAPAETADEQTSPTGYVPPPIVDSSAGNPGAFTDEPEELPQSQAVVDPYAATADVPTPAPAPTEDVKPKVEEDSLKPIEAPALEQSASYFDKPMAESMKSSESITAVAVASPAFEEAVKLNAPLVAAVEPDHEHGEAASYYRGDPFMPVPEPGHDEQPAQAPIAQPQPQPAAPGFDAAVMPSYELPTYNVWAGSGHPAVAMPAPMPAAPGRRSQTSSVHLPDPLPNPHPGPYEDPFADPPNMVIPVIVGHPGHDVSAPHQQAALENHEDAHATIVMPLPAFGDVVAHKRSNQSIAASRVHLDTDERMPLLARPVTPNKYLGTQGAISQVGTPANHASISPLVGTSSMWTNGSTQPQLIDLGWVEYNLPDGTTYFSHLTRRATTDLDLRDERVVSAVVRWMEERDNESVGVDLEGWLREAGAGFGGKGAQTKKKSGGWGSASKKGKEEPVVLERYWVDHHQRTVVRDDGEDRRFVGYGRSHANGNGHGHANGHGPSGKGKKQAGASKVVQEDQLDLEYRYWAFMEAHPAHLPTSHKAKAEALDVLTWALADRLLPSHRAIPVPFTQEECQELRTILRSFNRESDHGDHGIQTRIISRILLRVAQWRQTYFRPNKPLPKDVDSGPKLPVQRRPFRKAVFDLLVSCICLGIPYFFLERTRIGRPSDEESGLLRGPAPMLIIGACTCLIAAIVLSASVTFLSLPGLDGITRTTGMVAVLFAAFAMAATGVAILRHKSDLERPVSHVGVEGVVGISRRTIAFSLPLVFLAYSIIAFIAGITIYSFRGKAFDDPKLTKSSFEDYTRWTVVGVIGGLAGVVTTSLLVLRR